MLQIIKLSKSYGSLVAVKNISFTANIGEVVGFLGPNGAGKTTTMQMITGFLTPTEGQVLIDGIDMEQNPVAAKKLIGYLPEGMSLYRDMTVLDFLLFVAEIRGFTGSEKYKKTAEIIEKINLDGVLLQTIDTLSKGYKCRVGLAQALIHDPKLIILDEPTDGLDPNQKQEMRSLIKAIAKEKVIMISTHVLEEVEAICDRVMIINKGKIVVDSTPSQLIERSAYYNSVNIVLENIANNDVVKRKLESFAEIKKVDILNTSANNLSLRVYLSNDCMALPKVCNFIFNEKWQVTNFQVNTGHLQDVFRSATTGYRKER